MRSGSAQAEAAYLFVPAWLRMVSLRRPLFEEYDVIRPSGPIGRRCATTHYFDANSGRIEEQELARRRLILSSLGYTMAKLIYFTPTSLDGYIADGNYDWSAPDEDGFAFISDLVRPIGMYLYGRKMYEAMAIWQTPEFLVARRP